MDVDGREMGSAPKIDPKYYISGIWGHPLGDTAPCHRLHC